MMLAMLARSPGAFNFDGEHFHYRCPCGCGNVGVLIAAIGTKPTKGPSWNYNGDIAKPSLKPSINHVGHWHGWLLEGFWVQDRKQLLGARAKGL